MFDSLKDAYPFKLKPPKMFKHTRIRREKPRSFLSVFDHFVGLALKGLNDIMKKVSLTSAWYFEVSYKIP